MHFSLLSILTVLTIAASATAKHIKQPNTNTSDVSIQPPVTVTTEVVTVKKAVPTASKAGFRQRYKTELAYVAGIGIPATAVIAIAVPTGLHMRNKMRATREHNELIEAAKKSLEECLRTGSNPLNAIHLAPAGM